MELEIQFVLWFMVTCIMLELHRGVSVPSVESECDSYVGVNECKGMRGRM